MNRWKAQNAPREEQLRQLDERICERGKQVIGFLHDVLERDRISLHAFYGREFLTTIGGGKTHERDIAEMAEFIGSDSYMRTILSAIEQHIVSPEDKGVKIATMQEKAQITPHRNEEQVAGVEQGIAARVKSVTIALREILKAKEHVHLASLLRYAGGETCHPYQVRTLVEWVVREHPAGQRILSVMESEIGAFGVKVNREIEPLLLMKNEILRGRNLPAERNQTTKLTSLPGT